MGQTREQRIIKQLSGQVQKQTPIATDMFLPNHSGDHSAGIVRATPTNDLDIVNKKYCDTKSTLALGETSATAYRGDRGKTAYDHSQDNTQGHSDYLTNNANDVMIGNLRIDPQSKGDQTSGYSTVLQNVGGDPADLTNEYQLSFFIGTESDNRYQFTLANSGDTSWVHNFFSMMVHGSTYPNSYYLGENNAGTAMLLAQGDAITKLAIGTYEGVPLHLFTGNTIRITVDGSGNIYIPSLAGGGDGRTLKINNDGSVYAE